MRNASAAGPKVKQIKTAAGGNTVQERNGVARLGDSHRTDLAAIADRLRATIEASIDCVITINSQSEILEFNSAAERTFHYQREDVIGKSISDVIIPPSLREGHRRGMAALLRTGQGKILGKRLEVPAMHADGSEFPVELTVIQIPEEEPAIFTAFIRDITQRKTAEEKLRSQEEHYRMLFEMNPTPTWVYDVATLRFLMVNEAAVRQYGYSREEFLALTVCEIRPPEERGKMEKAVREMRGASAAGHWRHLRKDGSTLIASIHSSPMVFGNRSARITIATDVTEQLQAQEALLMQARLIESMAEGVIVADEEGQIVRTNPAFDRMFGYNAGELLGRHLSVLNDLDDAGSERLIAQIMDVVRQKTAWLGEIERRRKDGSRFTTQTQVSAFESGGKRCFFAVQEDITERKQTEIARAEAEQKYRSIFENAIEGIFQSTPEGKIIAANPAMARILGFTSPEELMRGLVDVERQTYVDPRRREELKRLMEEQDFVSGFEYQVYRKDGSKVWISENSRAVRDSKGQIAYFEGTFEDITERKRAEQQAREQAELLNLAHDAIAVRDLEYRIEFWNQGAEKLYGWTAEEVRGKRIIDLIYENKEACAAANAELLQKGEWRGELAQVCKDGRKLIVNSRWTLVRDERGEPQRVLVIHTDVTEQKKLEAQFLRSQRLESIGTLAAGVAHDLNNILAPILLVSPLLHGELAGENKEEFLALVQTSAERGASLVKQMLTFARGADGARVLLQPIYLVEEAAKIAEQTFPKTITVRTRCPQDLWLIEGDPTQLQQVLLNLCVNARDAMPEGGTLWLKAENFEVDDHYASMTPDAKAGRHVLIQVSDDGAGIPRHVIDKIFDPFFTTKEIGKGTGLGLSTVLGIVKNYGGFVNVYSEPGHTTFKVFLPVSVGATLDAVTPETDCVPPGRGETILVVDDETSILEAAQSLLVRHGYNVLVAEDGISALAIFATRSSEIDLILTDLVMPLMDGLTLMRTLRKLEPSTRIIVSTGRDQDCQSPEMNALRLGACLMKPYTREKLLLTIGQVLETDVAPA